MERNGKLKALAVGRTKEPGMYGDGGGLYLQVTARPGADGAARVYRSWIFRYWIPERDPVTGDPLRDRAGKPRGRSREMGLGALDALSLAQAREWRDKLRLLRLEGKDPIEERDRTARDRAIEARKVLTFKDAATRYMDAHGSSWRNAKHRDQWTATLETYAYPILGDLDVRAIDTPLIMKVLSPIWATTPETAGRVRGRIENVLDAAKATGDRTGDNPARWRGHLENLLPKRSKARKVKHHPALPYVELAAFMVDLRQQQGVAARALEWTILNAARTSETIGGKPMELDRVAKLWTVPGDRMKAEKEHRVPLADAALAILDDLDVMGEARPYVFPGGKAGRPLSNMAMLALIERMNEARAAAGLPKWTDPKQGGAEIVPHGFRSTFQDWAAECTNFPRELVDMALAHTVSDKVEAAYRRGDMFEKRRRLLEAWAAFCAKPAAIGGKVVALRSRSA